MKRPVLLTAVLVNHAAANMVPPTVAVVDHAEASQVLHTKVRVGNTIVTLARLAMAARTAVGRTVIANMGVMPVHACRNIVLNREVVMFITGLLDHRLDALNMPPQAVTTAAISVPTAVAPIMVATLARKPVVRNMAVEANLVIITQGQHVTMVTISVPATVARSMVVILVHRLVVQNEVAAANSDITTQVQAVAMGITSVRTAVVQITVATMVHKPEVQDEEAILVTTAQVRLENLVAILAHTTAV